MRLLQWITLVWCVLAVGAGLSGCTVRAKPTALTEQPITAPARPFLIAEVCLDTPPLFPTIYFRKAAGAVADRIDEAVTVNTAGMAIYVDRISSDSFQDNALAFRVPAVPSDPPMPQHPKSAGDYGDAAKDQAYQDALARWQQQLVTNHRLLTKVRQVVARQTNRLRTLADLYDARGADLFGCLADASSHLQQMTGEKFLVIASALLNNTLLQKATLNLTGVSVEVVWRTCHIASACQANDAAWERLFRQSGARSVSIRDPEQSEVSGVQF